MKKILSRMDFLHVCAIVLIVLGVSLSIAEKDVFPAIAMIVAASFLAITPR